MVIEWILLISEFSGYEVDTPLWFHIQLYDVIIDLTAFSDYF